MSSNSSWKATVAPSWYSHGYSPPSTTTIEGRIFPFLYISSTSQNIAADPAAGGKHIHFELDLARHERKRVKTGASEREATEREGEGGDGCKREGRGRRRLA
jgi:hypothetical protein